MRIHLRSFILLPLTLVIVTIAGCEFPRETKMEPIDPSAAAAAKDAAHTARPHK
jgi:hypothetical protein